MVTSPLSIMPLDGKYSELLSFPEVFWFCLLIFLFTFFFLKARLPYHGAFNVACKYLPVHGLSGCFVEAALLLSSPKLYEY